jgi:hypothetical protein
MERRGRWRRLAGGGDDRSGGWPVVGIGRWWDVGEFTRERKRYGESVLRKMRHASGGSDSKKALLSLSSVKYVCGADFSTILIV